jgi:NAD(P) transhydrogenase subunit alpha
MKNGSIIMDLAASTGGNTAVTKNGEKIIHNGVSIIGDSALSSSMPYDASKVYGKNILNFMQLIIATNGEINLNFGDDLVAGTCITHNGKIVNDKVAAIVDKVADTA